MTKCFIFTGSGLDEEDDDVELEIVRGFYEAPVAPPAMEALYHRNANGSLPGDYFDFLLH